MKPALSVIFFTVVSGAGFGLMTLAVLLDLISGGSLLGRWELVVSMIVGIVFATAGLLASTLHLANPKNAWRAFSRFRTSWLSREAVFSVLFYPPALGYAALLWFDGSDPGIAANVLGGVTALLALITVFCTGMIYASLRPIPQWNTPLVPANYLLLSLASGSVALLAVSGVLSGEVNPTLITLGLVLIGIAAIAKAIYFYWIGTPKGPSINTAIGLTRARARLLDSAQSGENFTTREFDYRAPAKFLQRMRLVTYVVGFALPAVLLGWMWQSNSGVIAALALITALAGHAVERWLFFAEARHTVNLFYGSQRV